MCLFACSMAATFSVVLETLGCINAIESHPNSDSEQHAIVGSDCPFFRVFFNN